MTYMLWMMTNMKEPLPNNIKAALDYHTKKYGAPPNIVEYSQHIEHPQLLEDESIHYRRINVPSNILLIGVNHEA